MGTTFRSECLQLVASVTTELLFVAPPYFRALATVVLSVVLSRCLPLSKSAYRSCSSRAAFSVHHKTTELKLDTFRRERNCLQPTEFNGHIERIWLDRFGRCRLSIALTMSLLYSQHLRRFET